MKNNHGFTLVELIATVIILSLIMAIAIPNVLSIIEKNKQEDFIESAKLLISEAEYKLRGNTSIELPSTNDEAIIITLNYLNSGNFDNSPYEYPYDKNLSFVLVARENNSYNYYVHLTATKLSTESTNQDYQTIDPKNRGINLADINELNSDTRFDLVVKGDDVDREMLTTITKDGKIVKNGKDIKINKTYN